jgi:RNA polymerase sigma factor (TIGR02999 family)
MKANGRRDITALLARWRSGSAEDEEPLLLAVEGELRKVASACMRRERPHHTLQPTALVNEAYMRLIEGRDVAWENRAHFFGLAARVMRQVLVDYARKRRALKREAPRTTTVSVSDVAAPGPGMDFDVLALHDALDKLSELDARQAHIVELRYFGGLTEAEVAAAMGLSPATIRREVAAARFWLGRHMRGTS